MAGAQVPDACRTPETLNSTGLLANSDADPRAADLIDAAAANRSDAEALPLDGYPNGARGSFAGAAGGGDRSPAPRNRRFPVLPYVLVSNASVGLNGRRSQGYATDHQEDKRNHPSATHPVHLGRVSRCDEMSRPWRRVVRPD